MADEVKLRTLPLSPLPNDEAFTPGGVPTHEHPPESDFWENVMFESNTYKVEHFRSAAQHFANDWDCAVLLHYFALPGFQHTNATMHAAIIPADEGIATPPAPPVEPLRSKW